MWNCYFVGQNFVKYWQFHIVQDNLQVNNRMQKMFFKYNNNNKNRRICETRTSEIVTEIGYYHMGVHCPVLSTHVNIWTSIIKKTKKRKSW